MRKKQRRQEQRITQEPSQATIRRAEQRKAQKTPFKFLPWLKRYWFSVICALLLIVGYGSLIWPEFFDRVWDSTFAATFSEDIALQEAVQERDFEAVQEALAEGANPSYLGGKSTSAICLAISSNQPDILKSMLDRQMQWNTGNNEKAPVLILAEQGSADMAEVVRLVLDADFFPLQDLIYFTSVAGNIKFLQFLLQTYPEFDINTTPMTSGVNLLGSALSFNHSKSLDFIFEHSTEDARKRAFDSLSGEYVIPAMASENATIRETIFTMHNDVNVTTSDGITPLMLAASQGNVDAVRDLLARGARIDMKNAAGETALMLCAGAGQPGTLALLIEAGGQIEESNLQGWTPLMLAGMSESLEAVKLLLKHGANVMARTHAGAPVLTHAVVGGNIPIVQELLKSGAEVNAIDDDGWSALMWACIQQGVPMVSVLLDNGANPHAYEKNGFNVLRFARNSQDENVLELLEDFMDL